MTQNFISCRLAKHFENPDKFIPDRWLKGDQKSTKSNTNPYLVLPFSHGMRSCIARRFAEQNMLVLMLRVIIVTFDIQNTDVDLDKRKKKPRLNEKILLSIVDDPKI